MAFKTPLRFRAAPAAAAAALLLAGAAQAQQTQTVVISARALPAPSIGGFGEVPLALSPLSALALGNGQLADAGVATLGNLTRVDASVGDAYNAEGYWSQLSVRGYALDNRFNYRRDGLPINAETAIALDNKARIDLLKGASGIQAGTSAPGGLVDLIVKRPTSEALRSATVALRGAGSVLGALDVSQRFGIDDAFGLRLNVAAERLDPEVRDTQGQRWLAALAADWRLAEGTLLEAEFEASHQRQPSVAGFSMLGNSVPDARAIDPRINLNRQPWRQPVVMDGHTASLRLQQRLSADWNLKAHAMAQRLKSDDRTAFPYGVYDPSYACPQWCDRFAPDGSFSYWEYISNNERRNSDALELSASGRVTTGAVVHGLHFGVLGTRYRARFQDQVFDLAGPPLGNISGSVDVAPSAGFTDANTNRSERSTEWSLRDAMQIGPDWSLWAGVRHTRLLRASERTSPDADGSLRATSYRQGVTTPWLALMRKLTPQTMIYASWGRGVESDVAPNRALYTNAGQALPALRSRQFEAGVKHADAHTDAALALFDIDRPQAVDQGSCDAPDTCTRAIDGSARHRGVEARLAHRSGPWQWEASALWLDAQRRGASQPGVNGLRPVNVPKAALRLGSTYHPAALPGLELSAALTAESDRMVLPDDNTTRIPGWARLDVGARWVQAIGGNHRITWRAGIDNLADRRAWKESPYQFGHVYLYPLAPRTWRLSAEATF